MASKADHDFTCPKCGCHYWGSSNVGKINAKIECHGYIDDIYPCDFEAPYEDIYKYTTFTIKPDSYKEYRRLASLETGFGYMLARYILEHAELLDSMLFNAGGTTTSYQHKPMEQFVEKLKELAEKEVIWPKSNP